jgi:hypothetical protein
MNKKALHAHDRGQERLNLSRESVDSLQRAADKMWYSSGYKKLTGDHYYSNIRDPRQNLIGYAAFKRVNSSGKRPRLILASILHKDMKPRGNNISHFFNTQIKDNQANLQVPEQFEKFTDIPNNKSN